MQSPVMQDDFVPRDYQITITEIAIQRNTIVFLPTGSGKTLIAVMILKRLAKPLQKPLSQGGKISVMIVNTVALVGQQSKYLQSLTDQDVAGYSGEMNVDSWNDDVWKDQFEKYQILVMTAQILVNLLQSSILSLKDVNLLIFDECHHGVQDHPMTQIMSYYKDSEEYPRIVGLSATLLNKNCKAAQVIKEVEVLESTFHSKVATVEDLECLIGYTTNPHEEICVYETYECSDVDKCALDYLQSLAIILKNIRINDKPNLTPPKPNSRPLYSDSDFNDMISLIQDVVFHIETFGTYIGEIAIVAHTIQLERIKKNCQDLKVATVIDAVMTTFSTIKKMFNDEMGSCNNLQRINKYTPPQVKSVFKILKDYKKKSDVPLCGIIFVQRRFTAKIIYNVLKNLSEADPSFSFIKPNFIVGFNTNPFNDTREVFYNAKMNQKVLNEFRIKNINLLVSSNVLEEGVDIPTCSLVVNFSDLHNYRAYIQSKGRARFSSSFYYMLVNSTKLEHFMQKYVTFQEVENVLNCHLVGMNEFRLLDVDCDDEYSTDEFPPYYVNGPDSAQVNLVTAIPLVCWYCQCLPSDRYTTYAPNWFLHICSKTQKYQVIIELPTVSGILHPIEGPYMQSKKLAKRAAALRTCILLHQRGELDDMLRPRQHAVVTDNLTEYFTHWPKEKEKKAGNTKHQRVYNKNIPEVCKGLIVPDDTVYLHIIEITPSFSAVEYSRGVNILRDLYQSSLCYGIISNQSLPKICQFTIYVTAGEILVNFNVNYKKIVLTSENISSLKSFHCVIFSEVLRILKQFLVFDNDDDKNGLLIVPIKKYNEDYEIDFALAEQHKEIVDQKMQPTDQDRLSLNVTRESYDCRIVTPWYRPDDQQYLVLQVCEDLDVFSDFPSEEFATYADYYNQKYRVTILHRNQPLLLVKALSKRLNCLKPRSKGPKRSKEKVYEEMEEHLIPELCIKQEFPAALWLQAKLLPTILNRIFCLLQADELRIRIGKESGLGVRELLPSENWEPLVVDKHVVDIDVEEESKSKKPEILPEDEVDDISELPTDELVHDFTLKKLNAEYPWSEHDEPIDIERNIDITLMDVQYYVNFISQKIAMDFNLKKNEIANRSNFPAIQFDKDYNYKEIKFLKHSLRSNGPELIDIFTALTTAKNNDIVNLERLETLGDSFLKVSISLFLILRYPNFDEGKLTNFKGQLISNKNLFYIGIKKNIPGYIKVSDFAPDFEWKPPSFCVPKILKTRINQSIALSSLFRFFFTKDEQVTGTLNCDSESRIIEQDQEIEESTEAVAYDSMYSFLDKLVVKDKTIADCLEALLGVYFQSYGFKGALSFLKWLEIIPPSENIENLLNMRLPNPVLDETANLNNIDYHIPTWKKVEEKLCYNFKNRGYLLQALTHSSYTPNRITNCYQTLEFLGDAVLDFLITCHIYETSDNLTPGDLTDLRSALVNNVTFACFTVRCGFQKHLQFSNTQLLRYIDNFVQHQEANNHAINEEVLTLIDENDLYLAEHIDVPKVLGDIFEALIGAVFLDSGMCLETCWKIIHRIMWKEIELFKINVPKNAVRLIYETVGAHPEFQTPLNMDNGRTMIKLEFMLNGAKKTVHGVGENKMLAKKAAAKIALRLLRK